MFGSLSGGEQLCLIKIEGMHCHSCESTLQRTLARIPGVFEAEVDFNACLASVLYNPSLTRVSALVRAVKMAGYQVTGCTRHFAGQRRAVLAS